MSAFRDDENAAIRIERDHLLEAAKAHAAELDEYRLASAAADKERRDLGSAVLPVTFPALVKCGTAFDRRERAVLALMQCMEAGPHDEVVRLASTSPDCQLGHADARKAAGCTWLSFWDIDARLYVSATSDRRSLWLADSERIYRLAHDVGTGAVDAVV